MNRNRRDLTRRFLPKFFLLPYGTLPNGRGIFEFGGFIYVQGLSFYDEDSVRSFLRFLQHLFDKAAFL